MQKQKQKIFFFLPLTIIRCYDKKLQFFHWKKAEKIIMEE